MTRIKEFWQNNRQFVVFIILMSVFRSAVADWYTVPTASMQPTIKEGDRIVVNKMAYDLRVPFTQTSLINLDDPKRGEIVVFESAEAQNRLIKRVIGLPGDKISMKDEVLFINGKALSYKISEETGSQLIADESLFDIKHKVRIDKNESNELSNFNTVTVPEDHYLVLGDNRRNSADSRVYGFVPRHELKGKALAVAFSLDYDNYYIPRDNRSFTSLYSE